MTKVKKEKVDPEEPAGVPERSYHELIANLNPIAQPLASKKLSKKIYKCVKKGTRARSLQVTERSGSGSDQNSIERVLWFQPPE